MKNKVKEAIQQIKRELSNAQYYAEHIEVKPKDRKAEATRQAIIGTLSNIRDVIENDLRDLEKEIIHEEVDARSAIFKKSLGTINSPTQTMRRTAENFLEVSKTPNALIKQAVQNQIRKASSSNARQTSPTHQHPAGHR